MFNAFEWNCFNLVDTCNIALILFLKCDVTKFGTTPCHTMSHFVDPPPPLNVWCNFWRTPRTFHLILVQWILTHVHCWNQTSAASLSDQITPGYWKNVSKHSNLRLMYFRNKSVLLQTRRTFYQYGPGRDCNFLSTSNFAFLKSIWYRQLEFSVV